MMQSYHSGAYGSIAEGKWSCCNRSGKQAKGCLPAPQMKTDSRHRPEIHLERVNFDHENDDIAFKQRLRAGKTM